MIQKIIIGNHVVFTNSGIVVKWTWPHEVVFFFRFCVLTYMTWPPVKKMIPYDTIIWSLYIQWYIYIYIVIKENNIASTSYGSYGGYLTLSSIHKYIYIHTYIYNIHTDINHTFAMCRIYCIYIQLDTYHDDIYITISWHVEMAFARIAIARIRKDFPSFKGRFSFENS